MRSTGISTMAVVACLTVAGAARGQAVQMDRTVEVPAGTRLQLDNNFGDVTIRTWDRSAVRVQGHHPVGTTVEIDAGGGLLQIDADRPGHHGNPIVYTLTIPADMAVEVDVVQGNIDVAGTRAEMNVQSVHGSVTIVGGTDVIAESVQGKVTVTGARGRMQAGSVNEGIELRDIRGDVQAEAVNGRIRMQGIEAGRRLQLLSMPSIPPTNVTLSCACRRPLDRHCPRCPVSSPSKTIAAHGRAIHPAAPTLRQRFCAARAVVFRTPDCGAPH